MSTHTTRPSPWTTAEEAAPYLATTPHSLRRLARTGRSPIVTRRVGSRWLFSRADLARFCDPDHTDVNATATTGRDDDSVSRMQVRPLRVAQFTAGSDPAGSIDPRALPPAEYRRPHVQDTDRNVPSDLELDSVGSVGDVQSNDGLPYESPVPPATVPVWQLVRIAARD